MKMKVAAVTLALTAGAIPTLAQSAWEPTRPIEFVAAAGPGGGTDMFARVVQAALKKDNLLNASIIVNNKPGGSGAETFIYARSSSDDPYKLFFGAADAYVLPLSNKLSYSIDDLQPIAAMTFDPFILWVNPKISGIEDVAGFIAKAKEKEGAVRVGGVKSKEADHTLVTLIEHAAGIKLTYLPFKSGSETATQVAGGHIEANVNNPSESVEQWRAGAQKPLCVFEDKRLEDHTVIVDGQSWNSIPTCTEAGLDVNNDPKIDVKSFAQPRTVWAAKNIPADAIAYYRDLMQKVSQSAEFKAYVARGAQIPRTLIGDDFAAFIKKHESNYRAIYARNGWLRPDAN